MKTTQSGNLVYRAFQHKETHPVPRGELWIGTAILKHSGLDDDLIGHLMLRKKMCMDLLCLPVSVEIPYNKTQGYRYFGLDDIKKAREKDELFLAVVVDGPFQRLSDKYGLMEVLKEWIKNRPAMELAYQKEAEKVLALVQACVELRPDALVIADDIASNSGPYIDPSASGRLFAPFYTRAVDRIHDKGIYALIHSCGNFSAYIPSLIQCGLDGLAACQCEQMDLLALKATYGSKLTFMAGIPEELLHFSPMKPGARVFFEDLVKGLSAGGGFILSSSTGLYDVNFIKRLREIYELADNHPA